ncbi:Na+/H+ antiporter subunit E [Gaoshiqia sediminis]|uniref:Na+/H+ antiporter subunit E n=1 Tax=Gaoshiqia sediminis TaxID=2986998 RepID=A0AA42C5G3_9BACT|nr:Na+/H+ antiporter subunit E [Gaoshiqia sediminis]MCW0482808.1 Na+/H+ antiporter subunit E [Gaoshiqia sediminis]
MRIFIFTGRFLAFAGFFLRKLVAANLFIAYDLITPGLKIKPALFSVPLILRSDLQILLLVNLISMTPGSLAVDVEPNKKAILIHSMYTEDLDKSIAEVNEFQERIKNLFV